MSDLEAALAAHLNGKFFWEPTATPEDTLTSRDELEIRRAQKEFAKGAKSITTRNKGLGNINSTKAMTRVLNGEQKVIEPIIKAVCEAYDVSPDDLMSHKKAWNLSKPRKHLYWAIFRYLPGTSLNEAGRLVGKLHTTVLYGRDSFEKEYDIDMVALVDELMGVK